MDDKSLDAPFIDSVYVHPEYKKFEVGLRRMLAWEQQNGELFAYVHRFRSDIVYPVLFQEYISPLWIQRDEDIPILAHWSICYSGKRETILKLLGFPEFCHRFRSDRAFFEKTIASVIRLPLSLSSNPTLYCANFPVGIPSDIVDIEAFITNLMAEYPSWVDAVEAFTKRMRIEGVPSCMHDSMLPPFQQIARTYYGRWSPHISEAPFFYYLNLNSISTHNYSVDNPFNNTPLKFSRHATTQFTCRVFNGIQVKDYGFLREDNCDWKIELEKFLESGGHTGSALEKFSQIDLDMLNDSDCIMLYRIIDMLGMPQWLVVNREEFVWAISKRNLEPPSCLRSHIQNLAS
jgi:hypothetical protein